MKSILRSITLLFLLIGSVAYAQTDSLRFSVRGTVRDAANGKALPYVSVTLPGTNYATVTNQDGTFVIKSDVIPRFVAFSLLGYKQLTVPADREHEMRVTITRGEYTLDPAQVIAGEPLSILRAAIYKITENCPSEPELFDCFYRETVQKRNRFIYIRKRSRSYIVDLWDITSVRFYVISNEYDLLKKRHTGLSGRMIKYRTSYLVIRYPVFFLYDNASGLGMQKCTGIPLLFADLQSFVLTESDHLAEVQAFGAVVQQARQLRFPDILPVAHGEGSRCGGHIQGVDETPVIQFLLEITDQHHLVGIFLRRCFRAFA